VQRGPVEKTIVDGAIRVVADLQQIWFVQSEDVEQVSRQLVEQMPSQQISPFVVLHSDDCLQAFGQVWYSELRQSPSTLRFGSSNFAVVQQISFAVISHSELALQDLGQLPGRVQIDCP
jgi:hypothetical protein